MSLLTVIFMFASWTSIFSLGKITLEYAPPLFLTSVRMLLAGILLSTYLIIRKKFSFKLSIKQFLSLSILAVFSIYLTNILEFWSLKHLSAAKSCFIYSLSPFFAALFSYIHFKEKMNKTKWIGMLIGFIGFLPILSLETGSEGLVGGFSFLSWPELAMIGAALCSVYGWVLLRVLVKDNEISPPMANGISMLIGGTLALIHSCFIDSWAPLPVASSNYFPFLKGVVIMTFISNILCYNLYGLMLKKYTATFLSFMGLLSPIFASLNAWILLGETPSPLIFASTAVVSLGLWIVYRAELKQGYIVTKKPVETNI